MSSFVELQQRFSTYGLRPSIEGDGFSYAYSELLEDMLQWQSRLPAMGVRPGSVVGLRADSGPVAIAALLALCANRVITALIPKDRVTDEYLDDAYASVHLEIGPDGDCECRDLRRQPSHPLLSRLRTANTAGLIIFTSGTTGRPKAAVHALERFLLKYHTPGRSLRTLAFFIFDHIAGLDTLFYTLSNGGTLIVPARRDPQTVLRLIASHRVQVLPTSPSFLRLLCALPDDPARDLSSLEVVTYGSEPMDVTTLSRLHQQFPQANFLQKYGTTEIGSPRTVSRNSNSLWLRLRGSDIQLRILDGVLWLRSDSTMLGYLNAPSPVDEDGWYCTGDIVEVDGEWIRFLGRMDETIKVGGEKVSPTEIERVIRELDFVRDVIVSSEPHPLLGHVVAARIALDRERCDTESAAARIRSYCRNRLSSHHVPVRVDIAESDSLDLVGIRQKMQRTCGFPPR